MLDRLKLRTLEGKKGLVIGVANDKSIAWAIAQACHAEGAELAFTYQGDALGKRVAPLAASVGSDIVLPCDVTDDASMAAVFDTIAEKWGRLDFLVHAIGFSDKGELRGKYVEATTAANFSQTMLISVYSFIQMARLAEPLMTEGGTLFTMSYYGAEKVVENYNVMGPVKAALEATTRYLAVELGQKGIRVHAISPGPVATRAASGIAHFDALLNKAAKKAPAGRLVTVEEVGIACAGLATDGARLITGDTLYIDGGLHLIG